jgi:hypothetical protein
MLRIQEKPGKIHKSSHRFLVLSQSNQFSSQSLFLLEHEQIDFPNAFHAVAKHGALRKTAQVHLPLVIDHQVRRLDKRAVSPEERTELVSLPHPLRHAIVVHRHLMFQQGTRQ